MFCILETKRLPEKDNRICSYVYCNEFHRHGWVRHDYLVNGRQKNGRKFPTKSIYESKSVEDYVKQWKWHKDPKNGYIKKRGTSLHILIIESILGHKIPHGLEIHHDGISKDSLDYKNMKIVTRYQNINYERRKFAYFDNDQKRSKPWRGGLKPNFKRFAKKEDAENFTKEIISNKINEKKELVRLADELNQKINSCTILVNSYT